MAAPLANSSGSVLQLDNLVVWMPGPLTNCASPSCLWSLQWLEVSEWWWGGKLRVQWLSGSASLESMGRGGGRSVLEPVAIRTQCKVKLQSAQVWVLQEDASASGWCGLLSTASTSPGGERVVHSWHLQGLCLATTSRISASSWWFSPICSVTHFMLCFYILHFLPFPWLL